MGGVIDAVTGFLSGPPDPQAAAREAGRVQEAATQQAIAEQRRQFETTRQQLDPFRLAGLSALNMQLALMGLPQIGAGAGAAGFAPVTPPETAPREPIRFGMGESLGPGGRVAEGRFTTMPVPERMRALSGSFDGRAFGGGLRRVVGPDGRTTLVPFDPDAPSTGGAPRLGDVLSRVGETVGPIVDGARSAQQIPQFTREEALAGLEGLPGQQFIRERQQEALLRRAAALGGLGGGTVRTALQQQAAGFAQQDLQNQLARLAALAGGGQQAAAQLGGFGQQTAAQIGAGLTGGAQARAGGILGAQQAAAQQAQQGANILGIAAPFLLSDERLKEDIKELDLKACFEAVIGTPLKSWRYLEDVGLDTDTHLGPMAQDAPDMIRIDEMGYAEMINLHDELMMIAGAIQYMKAKGMIKWH